MAKDKDCVIDFVLDLNLLDNNYRYEFDYDGECLIYMGRALSTEPLDCEHWQIRKFVYDNEQLLSVVFANGDSGANYNWTKRASYSY